MEYLLKRAGGALIEDLRYFRVIHREKKTLYLFDALGIEVFFPGTIFRDNEQSQVFPFASP